MRFVGIERRVAQLFGVHFAQAFEAGDRQALFAGGADGRQQAAQIFQAGRVLAAAEHEARLFGAGALLRNQVCDAKSPSCARSASMLLIVRTSCSSTMCSCAAWPWPLAVGRRLRRGRAGGVGHGQLAAGLLFLLRAKRVELLARGEPMLLAAQKDVIDRQLAA